MEGSYNQTDNNYEEIIFKKYPEKDLDYKNTCIHLHPLLRRTRLIEGLREIGFRLREERNVRESKPENLSPNFWSGDKE